MQPKLQLFSRARSSAAQKAPLASSAGQPSSSSLSSGRPSDLEHANLDNRHLGAAPSGGIPAAAFSNTQTHASNPATIQPCYHIVFNNNQGPLDLGTIHSLSSAPSPAPPPAADGILPTPPNPPSKLLPAADLRHRLDPRRPPDACTSSLPASRSSAPQSTPPAAHSARPALPAPRAVLHTIKKTSSAARRDRSIRSLARRNNTMPPPPPAVQLPTSAAPLSQDSLTQVADLVLHALQARLSSQGPSADATPALALAAGPPGAVATGPGVPPAAATEPPPPPPAHGIGVGLLTTPGPNSVVAGPSSQPPLPRDAGLPAPDLPQTPAPSRQAPDTPTSSSIGAFLIDALGRARDDRHSRQRSRSRSRSRGSRHSRSSRAYAPRDRSSGGRSSRSPRRRRSVPRRRSSPSDVHRRDRSPRPWRDASPHHRGRNVRRRLHDAPPPAPGRSAADPPSSRRYHRSGSLRPGRPGRSAATPPTAAAAPPADSSRPGRTERRTATSPPAVEAPLATAPPPSRSLRSSPTPSSAARRRCRRGSSTSASDRSASPRRADAPADPPTLDTDQDARSPAPAAAPPTPPTPPASSDAGRDPPTRPGSPGNTTDLLAGASLPPSPRSVRSWAASRHPTPEGLHLGSPPLSAATLSPIPSRDFSARLRFPSAGGA